MPSKKLKRIINNRNGELLIVHYTSKQSISGGGVPDWVVEYGPVFESFR